MFTKWAAATHGSEQTKAGKTPGMGEGWPHQQVLQIQEGRACRGPSVQHGHPLSPEMLGRAIGANQNLICQASKGREVTGVTNAITRLHC